METDTDISTLSLPLAIPTLLFATTPTVPVSIVIPTLDPQSASSNATKTTTFVSITISTSGPQSSHGNAALSPPSSAASMIPALSPAASKQKFAYLAIPFFVLFLVVSLLLYKLRRKRSQGSTMVQEQEDTVSSLTFNTSPGFGNNTRSWKRGYRDYRGSAASMVASVKLPRGMIGFKVKKGGEGRA